MYLEVKDLKKSYGEGGGYVQVLKGITAGVEQGEMCVIQGTSGSGKSTLLNCIGGLDTVDSGSIVVDGQAAGTGTDGTSEQVPGTTFRRTTATLCHRQSLDQESEPSVMR